MKENLITNVAIFITGAITCVIIIGYGFYSYKSQASVSDKELEQSAIELKKKVDDYYLLNNQYPELKDLKIDNNDKIIYKKTDLSYDITYILSSGIKELTNE